MRLLSRRPDRPRIPGRPPAWQRRLRTHRRVLAAVLAAVIVGALASGLRPAQQPTEQVVVAAHDLAPGTVLSAADLALRGVGRDAAPADPLLDPAASVGRTVSAPVRTGEAVRARDLVSPGLVAGLGAGMRALPVRLADDAAAGLVRAGDSVDVLASYGGDGTSSPSAVVVASDVRVLVAPTAGGGSAGLLGGSSATTSGGAVLVLATTQAQTLDLARAVVGGRLFVALRPEGTS